MVSSLTLVVDMHRCIHSRFCVTGAPKTFIANVVGPWLHPDESDPRLLVGIAHDCPSGAIAYRGKGEIADETAPQVNMMRVRENGPNAIHAPLTVASKPDGFRATFCRCGQSKNKPWCDGSHHERRALWLAVSRIRFRSTRWRYATGRCRSIRCGTGR